MAATRARPSLRRPHLAAALALVAALLAVGLLADPAGTPKRRVAGRPDLQRIIDRLVTGRDRIAPGVTAYVAGPHGAWTGSAGLADVATGEPMRPTARLRLESVSKLWTATTILQLVGDGRMGLGDTVERWLPGLLPYGDRITVRQLLDHTSGMVDDNDIAQVPTLYLKRVKDRALRARFAAVLRRQGRDPAHPLSARFWVDFAAALPLEHPPGTIYDYSNIAYMVAGLIAERVGGADLATLTRERIAGPLRLTSAAYDPGQRIRGSHARGYYVGSDGRLTDSTTWTEGLGANGGIVADAADEGRFLQSLMRGRLLGAAQLRELKRPGNDYRLGTAVDESLCAGPVYAHNGGGLGFESNVFVSGDGSRVAVLLLNGRTEDSASGDARAVDARQRLYCAA
jgi:D-alanyl-D-alanine carboxypeptidase